MGSNSIKFLGFLLLLNLIFLTLVTACPEKEPKPKSPPKPKPPKSPPKPKSPKTAPPPPAPKSPPPAPKSPPPPAPKSPSPPPPPPPVPKYPPPPPPAAPKSPPPPPPETPKATCPSVLQLKACVGLLNIIGINIGGSSQQCCPLLAGLADLEAAACLCTAVKVEVPGIINLTVPVDIGLIFNKCQRTCPEKFQCF